MRNQKKLQIEQLDRRFSAFQESGIVQIPDRGWIHAVRTTLNMTLRQLGERLKMTSQGAKDIENREVEGSISLKSLRDAGNALGLELVYGFVHKHGSFQGMIEKRSKEIAEKIVKRTSHNMELENQGNSDEQLALAVEELAHDIRREMRKSLWD